MISPSPVSTRPGRPRVTQVVTSGAWDKRPWANSADSNQLGQAQDGPPPVQDVHPGGRGWEVAGSDEQIDKIRGPSPSPK